MLGIEEERTYIGPTEARVEDADTDRVEHDASIGLRRSLEEDPALVNAREGRTSKVRRTAMDLQPP